MEQGDLLSIGDYHMSVSKNHDILKSSILIGILIINHPFWGTPIFGNTHIHLYDGDKIHWGFRILIKPCRMVKKNGECWIVKSSPKLYILTLLRTKFVDKQRKSAIHVSIACIYHPKSNI